MRSYIPITLQGINLKHRHRYLNFLIIQAHEENVPIKDVIAVAERSPIDRIFKIELASKYKYVEYILQNLKDDDMLFVSKSLKCHWLLDSTYRNIICPSYLEDVLYPEMIKPAVSKMKHWLQLHLKDPERCEEFYNYYKTNINEAIHFFWHCSKDFILIEFPNIIDKLTPLQMKILFEVCPAVGKLYFEILPNNITALTRYVDDERNYFSCVKYLLKYDGSLFLDIVEKYFNTTKLDPFSPSLTDYIVKNYKTQVFAKIELYASSILHLKTLASHVNSDEAKRFVIQLARAEYLSYWFSYKKVEPFIKRIKVEERASFKKQVFVDNTIDSKITEWPYPIPIPLNVDNKRNYVLSDVEISPYEYFFHDDCLRKRLIKKKCAKWDSCYVDDCTGRSPLDMLFSRYRFMGFEKTFHELSKRLPAEITVEGRLNMMLVLVSKSGGVTEQIEKLLKFLVEKHRNEPNTLRAAVIRSLVKRECVWRVQSQAWMSLLEFGWDLGLDGKNTELVCREGLHAVIIRHLLNDIPVSETLVSGFLRCFSTLSEYKFSVFEKELIAKRLPQILFSTNPGAFLNSLSEYKLSINDFPDAKPFVIKAAKDDPVLLCQLFDAKMLRRELFREMFSLKQTDSMFKNALRHDIEPLENGNRFASLILKERPKHDKFIQCLNLYFSEPGGLAEQHSIVLERDLKKDLNSRFVRPLCMLLSNQSLLKLLSEFNVLEESKNKKQLTVLAEIKANAHKTKPSVNIDAVEWQLMGAKAVANKVLICRTKDTERYLKKLLEWKRTARIALRLSSNTPYDANTFLQVSALRPSAALKFGYSFYLKKKYIDPPIWSALKTLINKISDKSKRSELLNKLEDPDSVPKNIEADYWVFVFNEFMKIDKRKAMPMLCRLENMLTEVDKNVVGNIINEFITTDLNIDKFENDKKHNTNRSLYFRIIGKHLLLCKSEDEQKELLESVCDNFFDALEILFKSDERKLMILECLDGFVSSLKYTKAFVGEYVTCIPVFERILKRLHKFLLVEENFALYVEIHLTMLFFKSIKKVIKLQSNAFEDPNNGKEAIERVGQIFGKYIGLEIGELVSKYFRSVIDLYKDVLYDYLRNYFQFNDTRRLLVACLIKGILDAGTLEAFLLAEHIFQKERKNSMDMPYYEEILKTLKESNDLEVKCLLNAHVLNTMI